MGLTRESERRIWPSRMQRFSRMCVADAVSVSDALRRHGAGGGRYAAPRRIGHCLPRLRPVAGGFPLARLILPLVQIGAQRCRFTLQPRSLRRGLASARRRLGGGHVILHAVPASRPAPARQARVLRRRVVDGYMPLPTTTRRCRSSVVEHPLGKGEVVSSILPGSTMILLGYSMSAFRHIDRSGQSNGHGFGKTGIIPRVDWSAKPLPLPQARSWRANSIFSGARPSPTPMTEIPAERNVEGRVWSGRFHPDRIRAVR